MIDIYRDPNAYKEKHGLSCMHGTFSKSFLGSKPRKFLGEAVMLMCFRTSHKYYRLLLVYTLGTSQ